MFTRDDGRKRLFVCAASNPLAFGLLTLAFTILVDGRAAFAQGTADDQLAVVARLHADGNLDEAASALQILMRSHPNHPEAHLWLARTRFGLDDWDQARESYARYTELAKTAECKAEGFCGIARTHLEEGNRGLAAVAYEEARELAPDDDSLQREIERSLTDQADEPAGDGFFQVGLFGVCGGRSAWWGWVLGLLIYVPGLIVGAANTGGLTRAQFDHIDADSTSAAGAAFVYSVIGTVIGFIIFWGLPATVLGWCLVAVIAFTASSIAAGVAAAS